VVHQIRNYLSVIVGFCDLLLDEYPESDRKRSDIVEIHKAATAAMTLLQGAADRR
jgi:hypothetical protein